MEKAYSQNIESVSFQLQTDLKKGLSLEEAEKRLIQYGPNALKAEKGVSPFIIFLNQFKSFLIVILFAAAIAAYFLGETIDASMILAIVILNGVIGFIQEYRVEKAILQLKKLIISNIQVIREGKLYEISSLNLVPGDLIVLEEGQKELKKERYKLDKDRFEFDKKRMNWELDRKKREHQKTLLQLDAVETREAYLKTVTGFLA